MRPARQPTITHVVLCHKCLDTHGLKWHAVNISLLGILALAVCTVSVIAINYQFYWYRGKAIITLCVCFNLSCGHFIFRKHNPFPSSTPLQGGSRCNSTQVHMFKNGSVQPCCLRNEISFIAIKMCDQWLFQYCTFLYGQTPAYRLHTPVNTCVIETLLWLPVMFGI
jgi:hypothetical protein